LYFLDWLHGKELLVRALFLLLGELAIEFLRRLGLL
jgi:hypothetical protein